MTREHLAPAAALAYMAMALGVIPYGAPVPYAYEVVTGILGVAAVALTFTDPGGRGKAVAYWPLLAILAAWAIAAATSPAPSMSFGRIYGMALYGMCFIAVQAIAWYALSLRALMWLVVATVIACVADVGMQWWGGASLFTGQPMKHFGFHGSQGNQNDLACVSILLPLTSAALPGVPGLMLYIGLSALTAPVWILARSRQIALGWFAAALPPLAVRLPRRWLAVAGITIVLVAALAVAISPQLRERLASTGSRGLGERGPIYAFGIWLFGKHWFTGSGPGLFTNYYAPTVAKGWSWMGLRPQNTGMPWVHSLPIEVLCETGIVGATAVIYALTGAVRRMRRAWTACTGDRSVLVAIITSAGCLTLIGLFDLTLIKDWVRICFWMILGLAFAMAPGAQSAALQQGASMPDGTMPDRPKPAPDGQTSSARRKARGPRL